jgi:hypothetical protein
LVRVVLRRRIIGTADLADYADISAALQKQILDVFIRFHQREDEAKKED